MPDEFELDEGELPPSGEDEELDELDEELDDRDRLELDEPGLVAGVFSRDE